MASRHRDPPPRGRRVRTRVWSAPASSAPSSEPGTARSMRAEAATANPSAGVSRRGRAYSAGRKARTARSETSISIKVSGVYGGVPQHAANSSSATISCSSMPKRLESSAIGASPTWASQPTMASSRRRRPLVWLPGARGAGTDSSTSMSGPRPTVVSDPALTDTAAASDPAAAAVTSAAPDSDAGSTRGGAAIAPTGSGASANASSHATNSSRNSGGSTMVAWSNRPSTHERMEANDVTANASSTDPSS